MTAVCGYRRPGSLDEALLLLSWPGTVVLGGGTRLAADPAPGPVQVVDLQALGLGRIQALVLRSSTQVPFHVRRMLAPLLGLPVKRIRVIKPRIGGGFGAKQEMLLEDIVGHLVLATRRPVRLELTREEELTCSRTRHAQTITFRTGVDAGGRLVAQDMHVVANTGPYGTHGFTVQSVTGLRGLSSYNCAAKRYTCDVAYTNRPVAGAFRGYGAPQAIFALECHMDDIARALAEDPIEFRRKNWVRTGDPLDIAPRLSGRGATGDIAPEDLPTVTSCGTEECVAQGRAAIGWDRRQDPDWRHPRGRAHIRRGIGFALCMHGSGIPLVDMASCSIKMNDDGSFNLLTGATDSAPAPTLYSPRSPPRYSGSMPATSSSTPRTPTSPRSTPGPTPRARPTSPAWR